ncbi:ankyrin repeat domain-containing protein [Rhodanobacter sp. Col0626]|uniref:ankyrin repeat domain-containing protein n=1 Tax=Rhodanobacter sp. Col0626 TaxID=3415679 RepID=UPI003CE76723
MSGGKLGFALVLLVAALAGEWFLSNHLVRLFLGSCRAARNCGPPTATAGGEELIFYEGCKPIRAKKSWFFKNKDFKERAAVPPAEIKSGRTKPATDGAREKRHPLGECAGRPMAGELMHIARLRRQVRMSRWHSRKAMVMTKAMRWAGLVMLILLPLAGCNVPSPDASAGGAAPSSQSKWFTPANTFKNPQALALARAAQDNNAEEVRRLIKDEHINPDVLFSEDDYAVPVVAWPVITQSLGGLKALLDNGADPNARDPRTRTEHYPDGSGGTFYTHNNAMVYAAMNEDPAYLKLLLEHGGDPNTHNTNDETLLFQAYIWHNQWQNVQVLVEHGADMGVATQGKSILGDYTQEGNFEAAYWLLQHGADPKAEEWVKASPNEVVRYYTLEDIFWYPDKPNMMGWKRKCQQWLLTHRFKRPPMPEHYRRQRKDLGQPYEEKDIPLL